MDSVAGLVLALAIPIVHLIDVKQEQAFRYERNH
jgi:hypothetical protein